MKYWCTRILLASWLLLVSGLTLRGAQIGPVVISFEEAGQTVEESNTTLSVKVVLSEPSLFDISLPYVVHITSTATQGEDEDDETGDFYIAEDDEDEAFDNVSPIIIESGETEATIYLTLENDDLEEGTEYIILEIVEDELTVAKLGPISRHTIKIIDNDAISVYFAKHEYEFMETNNISVPARLSAVSESDIELYYEVEFITLDDSDVDMDSSSTSDNPLEISAGASTGSIILRGLNDSVTDRNEGGANEETLKITLTSALQIDTGAWLEVDAVPVYVTIVDNDPLLVELSFDEDEEQPFEIQEYQTATAVTVKLTWAENPDEDEIRSTGADAIYVPLYFSGSATRGEDEDDDTGDYYIDDDDFEDGLLKIAAGSSSASLYLYLMNDETIEDDETITVTMGTPYYEDGGDLIVGEKTVIQYKIIDNDPVDLTFAMNYELDDELAEEDEDYEDILYLPASGSIAAESWQSVSIPIYLSSPSNCDVTFDLEIVSTGTTATMYDSDLDEDQDWDFAVYSPVSFEAMDDPMEVTISAGGKYASITVTLNDDDETPIVYGENPADDVEPDETIQFRISNLQVEDEGVVYLGESTTYTLTIKDLPDIDITALVTGRSPASDSLVNGKPVMNELTTLFEVHYDMALKAALNAGDYGGYRSIKAQFRTSNYDAADPDSEDNDGIYQYPEDEDLEDGEQFNYFVNPPHQLRYPSTSEWIVLKQGEDAVDDYYDESTASTYEIAPYILKPINTPVLNPDFNVPVDYAFDINDKLDWWVDFYSRGYNNFDESRIDPAFGGEHRLRFYLTTEAAPVYATSSSGLPIERMVPQPDGSMFIVATTSSASSVQVQYMDPGDTWKVAGPAAINTGGGSKLYWVDKGPPQTQVHPSQVPFRLYRVTSN